MAFQFWAYDLSHSTSVMTPTVNRRLLRDVDNPFHLASTEFVKLYRLTPDIAEDLIFQLDDQLRGSRITTISTENGDLLYFRCYDTTNKLYSYRY